MYRHLLQCEFGDFHHASPETFDLNLRTSSQETKLNQGMILAETVKIARAGLLDVLHKKRDLNKTHIEKLSKRFGVSSAVFF
jgi:antitoxin component HigA of HigAB toxin-antitoxin module